MEKSWRPSHWALGDDTRSEHALRVLRSILVLLGTRSAPSPLSMPPSPPCSSLLFPSLLFSSLPFPSLLFSSLILSSLLFPSVPFSSLLLRLPNFHESFVRHHHLLYVTVTAVILASYNCKSVISRRENQIPRGHGLPCALGFQAGRLSDWGQSPGI